MKICIEANIGSGKTTLMRSIHDKTRIPIFLEPVDEWSDWLNLFYKDPSRWGFTFNTNVLMTFNRWKQIDCPALYERSPMSCKEVFTELQRDAGFLSTPEYDLFNKLYKQLGWQPNVIIYLEADPLICMNRMKTRGRVCENEVTLEYLQAVDEKYKIMLKKAQDMGIDIHVVDANNDKNIVYEEVMKHVKKYIH